MAALKAEVTRIRTMATEMSAPATIKSVFGRQVFDSRGNPTVEVDLYLSNDTTCFRAMVPSGASTGIYEGALHSSRLPCWTRAPRLASAGSAATRMHRTLSTSMPAGWSCT